MNKTKKTILIVLVALIVVAAAITGIILYHHSNTYISQKEALNIALQDAGVDTTEILEADTEFEKTNYSAWYEVDFETRSTEYEYELDAVTGEILASHTEPRD